MGFSSSDTPLSSSLPRSHTPGPLPAREASRESPSFGRQAGEAAGRWALDSDLTPSGLVTAQSLLGFARLLTDAVFRVERKLIALFSGRVRRNSHHVK